MDRRFVLVAIAVLALGGYGGTFFWWKYCALQQSKEYGFKGYCFFLPAKENEGKEYLVRRVFLPLIYLDVTLFRGTWPAPYPTDLFSSRERLPIHQGTITPTALSCRNKPLPSS